MKESLVPILSKYDNKILFIVFLMLMVCQIIDSVIGTLADVFKEFTVSTSGIVLFIGLSVVYGIGQYAILKIVKMKNKRKQIRKKHFNVMETLVTITQYVLMSILILIIFQILFGSSYATILLRVAVIISYGLAVYIMGLLSYLLFTWFRSSRAFVVLFYGLACAVIAVYVLSVALIFDIALQEKQDVITPQTETTFAYLRSGALDHFLNHLQTFSSIGFFFLVWAGNILLLRQNVHRIGKTKFWVLMSAPLIAWSLFYLLFYQSILDYLPGEDVFAGIVLPVLVMMSSQIVALVLLGATFGSIAKALNFAPIIRDYMMITAYGFILFFTATSATISGAGYPPFGIVNVILLGPFSFLIFTGLYRSAICAAEDTQLRQSIKTLAKREAKLLDAGATTEAVRQLQNTIMATVRANAGSLEEQSGVTSSLTDSEIREQIEVVTNELKKYR